jgi:hypothetical protein
MKVQKIENRGTEINKVDAFDLKDLLIDMNLNGKRILSEINPNDEDFVYISNGFLNAVKNQECSINEWHHFFIKNGNYFECEKVNFN